MSNIIYTCKVKGLLGTRAKIQRTCTVLKHGKRWEGAVKGTLGWMSQALRWSMHAGVLWRMLLEQQASLVAQW